MIYRYPLPTVGAGTAKKINGSGAGTAEKWNGFTTLVISIADQGQRYFKRRFYINKKIKNPDSAPGTSSITLV